MSRAVMYDEVGAPEALHVSEVVDAAPGPGQVAVRIRAAGVNPYDAKVRSGFITLKTAFPRRIGSDLAGTVEAVGEGAAYADGTPIEVGDEVAGSGPGSIAERTLAKSSALVRRPENVPVEVAGSLWVAGLTAVSCVTTVPVGPDDTLLVGGASGAVGMVVCQLAVATGARVIGTGSRANAELIRSLGAEPVEYGDGAGDRVAAHGTITAVIDCHGRDALDIGISRGVPTERMTAIAAYAALDELGVPNVERAARTPENFAMLLDRIASGELAFPVAQTFPLGDIVAAFTAVESSHAPGKIVVIP